MVWDVFCRVVDNHGDLGVCWRLASDLAARGQAVRLWVDDARALQWMAPDVAMVDGSGRVVATGGSMDAPSRAAGIVVAQGAAAPGDAPGRVAGRATVEVRAWAEADSLPPTPGDVVVETFGCDLPPAFVARMAGMPRAPAWINLEYLTAEDYAERSHGLPSPQMTGPGAGLSKHFFYPGFTPSSGGLLRETDLRERQLRFDPTAWRAARGCALEGGERAVSLFCYAGAPVDALIDRLADRPTLLLACPGPAAEAVGAALGVTRRRGALRSIELPWLTQVDYDHLLWSCALNAVRGEDSFVRALWAGRPLLWHIYPQADGADVPKLDAFLARYVSPVTAASKAASASASASVSVSVSAPVLPALRPLWHAWNGWAWPDDAASGPASSGAGLPPLPDLGAWQRHAAAWRDGLAAQPDLATRLQGFVRALLPAAPATRLE